MAIKKNSYHNLLLFASILLIIIPAGLISGPFLPDLFIVIISIIFLYISISNREFVLFKSLFFKLFLIFYFYLLIGSIFSEYFYESIKPSITYIRFGLFSLAIIFILKKKENSKFFFYIGLSITIGVLLFDGYFQFIFGKNIFGYEANRPDRLSSLFFDELILGSYLGKILPVFCTFCLLSRQHINKYYVMIFILLIYVLVFLSGERSAFLTTTLYIVMISPFFIDIKKGIIFSILVVLIFAGLISSNKNIKSRYFDQMVAHTIPNLTNNGTNQFLPEHMGLFKSAIIIFKQNIFLGGGLKTFRIYCKSLDNKILDNSISTDPNKIRFADVINQNDCKIYKKNKNCSTHPHNYYLQLLSETGLIGFIFIFVVFLKLILNYFRQIFFLLKDKSKINKSNVLILSGLIAFIWPIITTGSFFNNWICSILFLQVGVYLYTLKNETKN